MKNWFKRNARRARRALIATAFLGTQLVAPISPLITQTAHAATQHADPWMFYAHNDRVDNNTDNKHIDIAGGVNVFEGPVKSNGDLHVSGSNNTFEDDVRYEDVFASPGSGDTYPAGEPQEEAFSSTWPGTLSAYNPVTDGPACTFGNLTTHTDIWKTSESGSKKIDAEGVYCTTSGDIEIDTQNFSGNYTFITLTGLIKFSGSAPDISPFADNLLAYSGKQIDWGIDISGDDDVTADTDIELSGLIHARNSGVKFAADDSEYCLQVAALQIQVSGDDNTFGWPCLQQPPQNGSVQVNKQVDSNGDGIFEGGNTEANALGFRWALDAESPAARQMGTTASDVTPGSHSVTENSIANYSFVGWFEGQGSCNEPDGTTLPVPINVVANQTTVITLCNERDTAQIRIIKHTDPTNDQGTFNLQLDGVTKASGGHGTDTQFITVPTGNYTVSETAGANTTLSDYNSSVNCGAEGSAQATTIQVSLSSNEQVTCTFTNVRKGSISGMKCEVNAGATNCTNATGLEGWTIFIDANGNGQLDPGEQSTTTASDGSYSFNNVSPGDYDLEEVLIDSDSWVKIFGPPGFTLGAGENATNKDFGNFRKGSISGFKFNDLNNNGTFDNEPKLQGWTITLFNDNNDPDNDLNNQVAQTTTDVNGNYSFTNLVPDTYAVCETLQSGWVQTTPLTNGGCHIIEINVSGETNPNTNFGNFQKANISGFKWDDTNGDGNFDNEPKLENWKIYIDTNTNGAHDPGEPSTLTAADGSYSFSNLAPGTYRICEELQSGWIQTHPSGNGCHTVVINVSGETESNINFGNFKKANINGFKWNDQDGNGLKGATEPTLQNWTIFIDENDNSSLDGGEDSTTTASDGTYSFSNLGPGTYRICEVHQTDWSQTFPTLNNGCHVITVESGQTHEGNFGNKRDEGMIIVKKELIPATDSGRFNLLVDSDTVASNVGDGGQGSKVVETGTYTVSETGFGATNLANYETTYVCTSDHENNLELFDFFLQSTVASGSGTTISNIQVDKDETITCTFTNKRLPTITIIKDTGTNSDQAFTFVTNIGSGTFQLTDNGTSANQQTFSQLAVSQTPYEFSENAINGWTLKNITCDSGQWTVSVTNVLSVTPDYGDNITCTFTNEKVTQPVVLGEVTKPPVVLAVTGENFLVNILVGLTLLATAFGLGVIPRRQN